MKQLLSIICIFLIYTGLYSQEIPKYETQESITLRVGEHEGEVGYNKAYGEGGGYSGPTYYAFSPNGNFYICDYINKRINVYNSTFNFIRTIVPEKKIKAGIVLRMKFDSKENITLLLDMKGLYKLDSKGKTLFKLPLDTLPKDVSKEYNFFNIEEDLVYYDQKGSDSKIMIIDNQGQQKQNQEIKMFRDTEISDSLFLSNIGKENIDLLQTFSRNNNILVRDNKILSTDFNIHRNYFETLKNLKLSSENINTISDNVDNKFFERISGPSLKFFDKNGKSYWFCSDDLDHRYYFIVVLSNKGELIDFFTTDLIRGSALAVSPDGDIYFIKINQDGCKIYKTIRP